MKSRSLFTSMILALIFTIVLGPGMATQSIQAATPTAISPLHANLPNLPDGDQTWNLLYIDGLNNSLNIGAEPSLAFDKLTNLPYISYYNNSTQELVLGRWVGTGGNCAFGAWWCPVVDTEGDVGLGSSLAIHDQVSTVDGKLGISYYDLSNKRLKFTEWACDPGCTWTTYNFPSGTTTFDSGRYSSLKYNSLGEPQIAYTYNSTDPGNPWSAMKFCKWVGHDGDTAGGAFNCEYVEQLQVLNCCTNPSLALDPTTDIPSIAYYDGQFGNLRYVQRGANGGGDCSDTDWFCYWIDFTGDVGKYPSLDIIQKKDGSVRTGIAYYDATNGKLKYAHPVAGTGNCGTLIGSSYYWQCDAVDTMGVGIPETALSLILDINASPTIAYQDFSGTHKALKIARAPGTVGLLDGNCGPVVGVLHTFRCDVLDPGGNGGTENSDDGFFPSIARSSSGLIHIAYKEYLNTSGSLKLAYQVFGTYLPMTYKK
jgi:hypothetical protein